MKPTVFTRRLHTRAGAQRRRPLALRLESLEDRWMPSSAAAAYGQLPLAFQPNIGQASPAISYLARGPGYSVGLTSTSAIVDLQNSSSSGSQILDVRLVGAEIAAQGLSQDQLPGVANYLIGNNPADWHTNVPTYGQVSYQNVYRGIDLVYHGNQGQLEYDFVVNPGSNSGAIRLSISGAQFLTLDAQGDLLVHIAGGVLTEEAPTVYQTIDGVLHAVAGRYVIENGNQIGFAVGAYDVSKPLVIDPVLQYSTYIGGTGGDEGRAITLDASGDAYIVGDTSSTDFPTAGNPVIGTLPAQATDAYISKLNADGSALLYSTYLGGTVSTQSMLAGASGIAIDASGDAFVTGLTFYSDFPTAGNPAQRTLRGMQNAFVAELNPTGSSLVYSTYLGGSSSDAAYRIAVDSSGDAYVVGAAISSDFPTLNALQPTAPSGAAFVTKLSGTGQLVYSTYLGGKTDFADDVAVDSTGAVYVTGGTFSSTFPTAGQPFQSTLKGIENVFVSKIDAAGTALVYSTYLGGHAPDAARAIALDSAGDAYVAGSTSSSDFPTAGTPFQGSHSSGTNGFVSKLNPGGSALLYSTYLGGSSGDTNLYALAVDAAGDAYVTGGTFASNFPTAGNAPQRTYAGGESAVVVSKLNPQGSALLYSTFLGNPSGNDQEDGFGIAVGSSGNAYVTGDTQSTVFPTNTGVVQPENRGGGDGFVTELATLPWQVTDLAVASDNLPRLLWSGPGWANLWQFDSSLNITAGPALGPISGGWNVVADAAGADGLTRVLWDNAKTGQTALWVFSSSGAFQTQHIFAPMAGFTPRDMVVDASNNVRILWTNDSGHAFVSTVNGNFAVTTGPVFGPVSGWTALKLAAGSDGLLRLLWDNSNGQASLWLLNADGSFNSATVFGPFQGWTATDIAVGSDGVTRLLWSNPAGDGAVWDVSNALTVTAMHQYGPFTGYIPTAIECAANGTEYVAWRGPDGSDILWQMTSADTFQKAVFYGPVVIL